MKQTFYTLLFSIFSLSIGFCQYPLDAVDFTATDLNGVEHNLFKYLDEGKVVLLDVSATWCGPCWSLHKSHALEEIHKEFGPEGTNQVVVLYYEGDETTTLADLQGTGTSTLGNWLEGSSYPFFNESPVSPDFLNLYAPFGFPTVNVIDPATKKIVADVYDRTKTQMVDIFTPYLMTPSSAKVEIISDLKVFPIPATNIIEVSTEMASDLDFTIANLLGQIVMKGQIQAGNSTINISNLTTGQYILSVTSIEMVGYKSFFVK